MEDGFHYWATGLVGCYAGIAATAGEDWAAAEEHFEAALRRASDLPFILAQPETRRWYAAMLLERSGPGDADRAQQMLAEAINQYQAIGMPKHVDVAEAMLRGPPE